MAEPARSDSSIEPGAPVSMELHHEITLWLYREARLLDEERYREWLDLLAKDLHYWMPLRENRFRKDRRPEPTPETSANVFNDDWSDMEDRFKRFETGLVWSEDPPPRVNRMVNNVEVEATGSPDELEVYSNVVLYRNQRQDEEVWFTAKRRDRLRREGGRWKLARRHVFLSHHVICDENIGVLF